MVTSHLRIRRILNKTTKIVLKTNKFQARFGPKIQIRSVVASRGIYIGVLYPKLLGTDYSLCMPNFMILIQRTRFCGYFYQKSCLFSEE